MANKGADAGKAFLAGVLSKLPPELRGEAEKVFGAAEFQTAVGDGVLAQSDYTRLQDELRAQKEALDARAAELQQRDEGLTQYHEQLTDWYSRNKPIVEAALKGKPAGGDPPKTPETPPSGFTEKDFEERMAAERAAYLGYDRDKSQITREHYNRFKEIVDIDPLLHHPKIREVGLLGVYELVHKDRLEKYEADRKAEAEAKIRADERQKTLAEQASMPYPTPTGIGSGSPLDALKPAGTQPVVDAAVAEYNRLQQERLAGTRA